MFAPIADELAGHPCKQTWFSAADREMQAETFAHLLMKELMALAAGLPTIFQDREDVAAGGFASYWLCQRHTSWQFGSPDDEQVEAPTFLSVTYNGRAVTGNGTSKNQGEKCTVRCT